MSKKPVRKASQLGEAAIRAIFVVVTALGALSLLNFVELNDASKALVGYVLAAFCSLVFGYLVLKSVENKV